MFVGDGRGTVKGPLLMVQAGHFGGGGGAGWPDVKHHQTQTHTRTVKLQPYFKAGAQYHKTLFIIRPE